MRKAKQFLGVMLAIMMVFGYLLPLTAEASAVDCSGFECEDHEHHDHDVLEQCDGDHTECGEHDECDLIDCADCSDDAHCDCEEGFASSSSTSKSILKQQAACNHTYAWVNTKNPTCTAKGTKQYRCTKCNAQYYNSPTLSVDALGHNWTTVTTKQPTCGTSGAYVTKCSRCGAGSQNGNGYISATGKHNWVLTGTTNATCTANGAKNYKCSVCGQTKSDTLNALGHNWDRSEATCTAPKKCTRCGTVAQNALGHSWDRSAATCTAGQKCTRCGAGGQAALGHNWNRSAATCTDAKSCTRCGTVAESAKGHSWDRTSATCTMAKKCTRCGTVGQSPLGHNWNRTAATCTEAKVCTRCNTTGENAKGHSWDRTSATCTADKKCKTCGAVGEKALGHNYQQVTTLNPTCGAQGTYVTKCTRCGAGAQNGNGYITPTGKHNWVLTGTTNATCTANGAKNYKCSVCGQTKSDTLNALGHNWDRSEATCTAPKKCTRCGTVAQNALGHNWDRSAATCTAGQKCTRCGAGGQAALGHNWNRTAATCTDAKSCTRCGTVAESAKGHSWDRTAATCTVAKKCNTCGTVGQSPLGHNWNRTAATCTEAKVCTRCNTTGENAKGHSWDRTSATCTADKKCKTCGAVGEKALGHNYKTETTQQPTCGEQGIYVTKCTRCGAGAQNGNGYISATGEHTWKYTSTTNPTCTSDGYKLYTCTGCSQTKTEKIDKLGHNYKQETIEQPTCGTRGTYVTKCSRCGDVTQNGNGYITPTGNHKWDIDKATCTRGQKCTVCGDDGEQAKGHRWNPDEEICTKGKYCLDCEYEAQKATGHVYSKEATCTEAKICDKCHYIAQEALGHKWKTILTAVGVSSSNSRGIYEKSMSGRNRVGASSLDDLSGKKFECEHCQKTADFSEIQANGDHNWILDDETEPTCTTPGYIKYHCSKCTDTLIVERPELGHICTWKSTDEPTCITPGMREYSCDRDSCRYVAARQEIPGGHNWNNAMPTCTEDKICSVCGLVEGKALGHDFQTVVIQEPTCTEKGTYVTKCIRCNLGQKDGNGYITPNGHKWVSQGYNTEQYPCSKWENFRCSSCGEKKRVPCEGLEEHVWEPEEILSIPTLSKDGEVRDKCTVCNHKEKHPLQLDIKVYFYFYENDSFPSIRRYSSGNDLLGFDLPSDPDVNIRFKGWKLAFEGDNGFTTGEKIYTGKDIIRDVLGNISLGDQISYKLITDSEGNTYIENNVFTFKLVAVWEYSPSFKNLDYTAGLSDHFVQARDPEGNLMYGASQSTITKDEDFQEQLRGIIERRVEIEMNNSFGNHLFWEEFLCADSVDELINMRLKTLEGGICGLESAINVYLYLEENGRTASHEHIKHLILQYLSEENDNFDWLVRYMADGDGWPSVVHFLEQNLSDSFTVSSAGILNTGLGEDFTPELTLLNVKNMLNEGIPVIMAFHSEDEELVIYEEKNGQLVKYDTVGSHYFVVTAVYESPDRTRIYLRIASWGTAYVIDWNEYVSKANKGKGRFGCAYIPISKKE